MDWEKLFDLLRGRPDLRAHLGSLPAVSDTQDSRPRPRPRTGGLVRRIMLRPAANDATTVARAPLPNQPTIGPRDAGDEYNSQLSAGINRARAEQRQRMYEQLPYDMRGLMNAGEGAAESVGIGGLMDVPGAIVKTLAGHTGDVLDQARAERAGLQRSPLDRVFQAAGAAPGVALMVADAAEMGRMAAADPEALSRLARRQESRAARAAAPVANPVRRTNPRYGVTDENTLQLSRPAAPAGPSSTRTVRRPSDLMPAAMAGDNVGISLRPIEGVPLPDGRRLTVRTDGDRVSTLIDGQEVPVGAVLGRTPEGQPYVDMLHVPTPLRRKGVGRAVFQALQEQGHDLVRSPGFHTPEGQALEDAVFAHPGVAQAKAERARVAAEELPSAQARRAAKRTPPVDFQPVDGPTFAAAVERASGTRKGSVAVGDMLSGYTAEDYSGMRTFLSEDGRTGYAIKPDGDLVSVFNTGRKGSGGAAVLHGVRNGATKLDAFEPFLPSYYSQFGFRPLRTEANWTLGEAPVTYMEYAGGDPSTLRQRVGSFEDYRRPPLEFGADHPLLEGMDEGSRKALAPEAPAFKHRVADTSPDLGPAAESRRAEIQRKLAEYVRRPGNSAPADDFGRTRFLSREDGLKEGFHRRVARAYGAAPVNPGDATTTRAYAQYRKELEEQYRFITDELGIKMVPTAEDPYPSSADMMHDMLTRGQVKVFTGAADTHPLVPAEDTVKFRFVHDVLGHGTYGNTFGPRGEENAFRAHAELFSPEARGPLAALTRGQNSWVNYGPMGEANRAAPKGTVFAEQKATTLRGRLAEPYGAAPMSTLRGIAGAGAGAAGGAAVDKENRTRGAVVGAAAGAALALAPELRKLWLRGPGRRGTFGAVGDFVSRIGQSVDSFPQEKGTAAQWQAWFRDRTAVGERKAVGLDEFLENYQSTLDPGNGTGKSPLQRVLTRDQVRAFFDRNAIKLEETTLGAKEPWRRDQVLARMQEIEEELERHRAAARPDIMAAQDEGDSLARKVTGRLAASWPDLEDIHVAERTPEVKSVLSRIYGGDQPAEARARVRELHKQHNILAQTLDHIRDSDNFTSTAKHAGFQLPGPREGYREVLVRVPGNKYQNPNHWDEEGVILHLRMSDRRGANGEKILHVEEVQSDLHQAARKRRQREIERLVGEGVSSEDAAKQVPQDFGYVTHSSDLGRAEEAVHAAQERYARAARGSEEQERKAQIFLFGEDRLPNSQQESTELAAVMRVMREHDPEQAAVREELRAAADAHWHARHEYETLKERVGSGLPDAPFKQTDEWMGLGMKRVLEEAARGGYDRVTWTTGSQQAARYDLRQHVRAVHYNPERRILRLYDANDDQLELRGLPEHPAPEDLPAIIGQEVTDRLLAATRYNDQGFHTLEGESLAVGGQGMVSFYDRMIPNWLKSYGKKIGVPIHVEPAALEAHFNGTLPPKELAGITLAQAREKLAEVEQRIEAGAAGGNSHADRERLQFLVAELEAGRSPNSLPPQVQGNVRVAQHREALARIFGIRTEGPVQPSFAVTPELRERIKRGQTLLSALGTAGGAGVAAVAGHKRGQSRPKGLLQ